MKEKIRTVFGFVIFALGYLLFFNEWRREIGCVENWNLGKGGKK